MSSLIVNRLGWAIVLCVFPTRIQNTDHKIKTLRKMISTLEGIYIPKGISTQFLPNEELAYDPGTESMRQVRYGGPLVPGTLELNYGATWCPWPMSSVQFGFATAKVIATPRYALQDTTAEHTISAPNMVLDMEYGASVVANINHPLNDRLEWINSSRAFCNAFDRDHISFEVVNRLAIKLWKYVELRLDTHVGYDPLLSYKVGFSQEVLLGFFYQKQVSK